VDSAAAAERRTARFKRLIARTRASLLQREDWLLLREQRIAMLERQIGRVESRVLERDGWLLLREQRIAQLETEIDQRGALIRQREARVRSLEILLQGRDAELHLLRTALDQAEDVLRKREAKLMFLEWQPEQLGLPVRIAEGCSADGNGEAMSPAAIIKQWQRAAAEFASLRLTGGQELIDPYILERSLHGCPTRLLIATRQAQKWYDRLDLTEGPYLDALQMVRPGQTVFDCGAHHGVRCIRASSAPPAALSHLIHFR
jgi:hypothetical protein